MKSNYITSKYRNVIGRKTKHGVTWYSNINNDRVKMLSERDAALFVDKEFIKQGKEPINILKRKL